MSRILAIGILMASSILNHQGEISMGQTRKPGEKPKTPYIQAGEKSKSDYYGTSPLKTNQKQQPEKRGKTKSTKGKGRLHW